MRYILFTLCFFSVAITNALDSEIRVEPPNWWANMEHNEVQIMLYGEDISQFKVQVNSTDIELSKVILVENPNYVFLDVIIPPETKAQVFQIELLKKKKVAHTIDYEIKERESGSSEVKGFDASDVMYLITPDRFANGNPSNDEISGMLENHNRTKPGGRHGGDIKGISEHLNYIHDLGFTAIWLNPIIENDMAEWSYHGYAATDFYSVDRRFGSNEEYKTFISKASKKGIKVIMDMIMNHCGSSHWFVLDPPMPDWINHQGNYTNTSHRRTTVQDIHASEADKEAFSNGWFVPTMPDLNQKNPIMSNYLIQNTIWWIEYSGISGIRMDTYPYPDKDFMTDWTCAVMNEYPNFSIVGEEWTTNAPTVAYWQAGKVNHDGYTSCLPSVMDFPLQSAITSALLNEKSFGEGMIEIYKALSNDYVYAAPDNLVIFPDNHDMDRISTQLKGDIELMKLSMVLYSTLRGTPQFFYGTEILMNNDSAPGDHLVIRTDFPGGWEGDKVNGFKGDGLSKKALSFQKFTSELLNWRKDRKSIHEGKLLHFVPENEVYVYFRYTDSETTMVIINKSSEAQDLDLNRFNEVLEQFSNGKDAITAASYSLKETLTIKGKSSLILELE